MWLILLHSFGILTCNLAAGSTEELRALLDSEEFEFRFEVGMATPTSSIPISDKKELGMSMTMQFVVYKTKAELKRLWVV